MKHIRLICEKNNVDNCVTFWEDTDMTCSKRHNICWQDNSQFWFRLICIFIVAAWFLCKLFQLSSMAGAVVALMKISNNLLLDDNEDAETLSMSQRRTSKMLTFVCMRGSCRNLSWLWIWCKEWWRFGQLWWWRWSSFQPGTFISLTLCCNW